MKIYFEEVFPDFVHGGKTIVIPVEPTTELDAMVDAARAKDGKHPFFNEYPGVEMDMDGWYEYRLVLNGETFEPIDFKAWGENCSDEDAGIYHFDIVDKESVMADVIRELKEFGYTLEQLRDMD